MILEQDYARILANLSRAAPEDLDAAVFEAPKRAARCGFDPAQRLPATALWAFSDERVSRVGIRIVTPVNQPEFMVARLAAIAIERKVLPIILSHIGASDFTRFGFRVEHVSGATADERRQCEEQIKRFWKLAMIVDASDVARLG